MKDNITESVLKCYICNICYDIINDDIHRCHNKCNSQYHKLCAKNWATKTNTCPFCRSNNFCELPDLSKFYEYCKEGNLEEIKKLNLSLEDIKSVNTKHEWDNQPNFALICASYNGHLDVVKYLCEFTDQNNNRLDIDDIRSKGWDNQPNYALREASSNGHLNVVKYLKEKFNLN